MAEGRAKKSIRNITYRMISQVMSILLKFVSRSIFISILGVEYLGINGLFSEILQMLSLADLGFNTAMVFSMYEPLAKKNEYKLAQLVMLYRKIYRIIAITIFCLGLAITPFLQYLVKLDSEIPLLRVYYLLYLANTVASYLVVYKTCILTADQKGYLLSKYDTFFSIASTIACCLFLYFTHNFLIYLIVQVFFTYARNFYCSHVTTRLYPYISMKVDKISQKESRGIFENIKSVFVYKLATTLVGSTDNTLISVMIGTVTVGLYSNYSMVITNVTMFVNILFSSVTASLGNLLVEANNEKNYSIYRSMQTISFILSSFSVSCVYSLMNDFISVWIGNEFLLDNMVLIAIVVNMYFSVVLMPIWSYREAAGLYRQTKYVMVVTAIVNLLLSIALGKIIGLAGILIATSIARISTYFWYEPKLLFKQYFSKSVIGYYVGIGLNILASAFVLISTSILFRNISVNTWLQLLFKAMGIALVSIALSILLYFRTNEFKKLISRFRFRH